MENEPAPAASAAPVDTAEYSAGFWLRGGAYMIDGVIVGAASVALALLLPGALGVVARLLLSAGYFTIMLVKNNGQTVGKMAAGVAVVRDDGTPIGYGRALARWFGYLASGLTLCLGFICAAFTNRKRALHDYIADTRVVRVEEIGFGRKFAVIGAGLCFPLLVVLGIAAALAIPKFSNLAGGAPVSGTKARLAALRSAVAIYYGDTKGAYPADLNLLVPKYLPAIEPADVPDQPPVAGVETYGAEVCAGAKWSDLNPAKLRGTGKWGYVVAPKAPCEGMIFVDSTRLDDQGKPWYTD